MRLRSYAEFLKVLRRRSARLLLAFGTVSILLLAGCPFNGVVPPIILSVNPSSIPANAGAVTITITGSNFTSTVISVNGQLVQTTGSGSTLQAIIPASLTSTPGTLTIIAINTLPGGSVSSAASSIAVTQQGAPVLAASKTNLVSIFHPAGTGEYMITVSNTGNAPLTGTTTVTDVIPAGLSLAGSNPASGTGWNCAVSGNPTMGFTVTCTRSDSLSAGTSFPQITIAVIVATNASGTITNTAVVTNGSQSTTAMNSTPVM